MTTPTKAKRSSIWHYLKTGMTTDTVPKPIWNRLGLTVESGEIAYNPETEETTDITLDSKVTEITSYKRSFAVEGVVYPGDAVFDYIDGLRTSMAVLDALHTQMVNVWAYKQPTGDPKAALNPALAQWPAECVDVTIGIESIGGDGASTAKIKYTIYDINTPVAGFFEPTTKVFTAGEYQAIPVPAP